MIKIILLSFFETRYRTTWSSRTQVI